MRVAERPAEFVTVEISCRNEKPSWLGAVKAPVAALGRAPTGFTCSWQLVPPACVQCRRMISLVYVRARPFGSVADTE